MIQTDSPIVFLATVVLISLSGVIMPGPVFAITIAKGYEDFKAGIKIASGHAAVEFPLIAAIFFGLDTIFKDDLVFTAIGLLGGILLFYMSKDLLFPPKTVALEDRNTPIYGSFVSGMITTAINPYFLLWWATVGAALIIGAIQFGLIMLPIFAIVHISCDFAWYQFVSTFIYKSKKLWDEKKHRYLFITSGLIMIFFGLYFILSSIARIV
ncbi:MAG: LysE family transporter [Methanomassiliicoccales archaeon]|jgi:threonine/homoserine/homoserine lactone efflux protein|nr:LysE family transporter [Methanomassiliicoccales archaeon]